MTADRILRIRARLEQTLSPSSLDISDDSHLHVGHAGARDGRGHFTIQITSDRFEGIGRLPRHRLVYEALGDLMQTDIHAVKIHAHAPAATDSPPTKEDI